MTTMVIQLIDHPSQVKLAHYFANLSLSVYGISMQYSDWWSSKFVETISQEDLVKQLNSNYKEMRNLCVFQVIRSEGKLGVFR